MDKLLLDTHIAIWLDRGDVRLRNPTRILIESCRKEGGTILLSAISAWEIASLVHGGRLDLDVAPSAWVERFLGRAGVAAAPLTPNAAARAHAISGFESRDPADRLLIATAIELGCPLVTYDARMIDFAAAHGRECGFTVRA
ncbi:MAG: type II toxin-antitoxin system VapC family toxin [Terriglobales bacterium]